MNARRKTVLTTLTSLLLSAAAASAAPLDRAHVPADATWLIHVDIDGLQQTACAKFARENYPDLVQGLGEWLQDQYGIDPRQDLHSLTMFSDTYETHSGAAVLTADFDMRKAASKLKEKDDTKEVQWRGHTIYVCRLHKDHEHAAHVADRADSVRDKREAVGAYTGDILAVLLLDGKRAILSGSVERTKNVANLLMGEGESLADRESPLVADIPEGTVAYGAAIDLQNIQRHEGVFPVLRQHQRIFYATGERGSRLFEYLTLDACSEEVAQRMEQALQGLVALVQVWAADSKALSQLASEVEVSIDGKVVQAHWEGEAQTVMAGLGDAMQRWHQWQHAMTQR